MRRVWGALIAVVLVGGTVACVAPSDSDRDGGRDGGRGGGRGGGSGREPTAGSQPRPTSGVRSPPGWRPVPPPSGTGRVGGVENPRRYPCERAAEAMESKELDPRSDVVHGPLVYLQAKEIADPSRRWTLQQGSVKIPLYVAADTTVTVTIAPEARDKAADCPVT